MSTGCYLHGNSCTLCSNNIEVALRGQKRALSAFFILFLQDTRSCHCWTSLQATLTPWTKQMSMSTLPLLRNGISAQVLRCLKHQVSSSRNGYCLTLCISLPVVLIQFYFTDFTYCRLFLGCNSCDKRGTLYSKHKKSQFN